ncbi:MAG: glycosyltransferase family 39 protein [Proteobacteria bacterium]|nr:glycosyltransferase family 39 protein [Pseudomonadota bacterium]
MTDSPNKLLPRPEFALLLVLAAARLLLHLVLNQHYGFHRDELQVLADAQALDWGYVPYPPLVPWLARIELILFGTSLTGLRAFAALSQCLVMLVAGLIARELGGGRLAQLIAALATACMPFSLVSSGLFIYSSIDFFWWVLAAWLLLRLVNSGEARGWLLLGAVFGLGLMTRYTILVLAAGMAIGVLATPLRRQLLTPWPWLGVGIALLIFLPNLVWQWQHDFIYLDFVQHIHARDVRWGRTQGYWVEQLYVNASALTLPLWFGGLAALVFTKTLRPYRILAIVFVGILVLYALSGGRGYYSAPAYPMLLAAGAVALESWLASMRAPAARAMRVACGIVLVLAGASSAACGLQIGAVNSAIWNVSRKLHDTFAEQIGWPEYMQQLAAIYQALPEAERARTAILTNNYGEAGAIDLYGPALGLPRALSRTNTYWYRGRDAMPPQTVIVLGDNGEDIAKAPATCTLAGRLSNREGVVNEESKFSPEIFICRDLRVPWSQIWGAKPRFG